jgi:acyl-CoA thioesterase
LGFKFIKLLKGKQVVDKMLSQDEFSKNLGISAKEITENSCKISLTITKSMVNGFGIAHGGITYSLADSALAFASNSNGIKSVSIETQISHLSKVLVGDVLMAEAKLIKETKTLGWYEVAILNQENKLVAHFKGTVYKTKNTWE